MTSLIFSGRLRDVAGFGELEIDLPLDIATVADLRALLRATDPRHSGTRLDVTPDQSLPGFIVTSRARTIGQTGVEMEALTAVSIACLTLYDMPKAIGRGIVIEGVCSWEKHGGVRSSDLRAAP